MFCRTVKVKNGLQVQVGFLVHIQGKCQTEENPENHALKVVHTNSLTHI